MYLPTPLIKLEKTSTLIGVDIYAKLELVLPTGSHKDRETMHVISDAINKGFREVAIASTGNAAISLATFSRINKLKCHVFVHRNVIEDKLRLIAALGATIHMVEGNLVEAFNKCLTFIEENNVYDANPGRNFKKIEGDSKIAEEIIQQLGKKPHLVFVPTNNGTLFSGVWHGFRKMGEKPIMIGSIIKETRLADSIAGFTRLEGKYLDNALRESNGKILEVDDGLIIKALKLLLSEDILCEPASATSLAALLLLKENNLEIIEGPIVLIITGSIIRFPNIMKQVLQSLL